MFITPATVFVRDAAALWLEQPQTLRRILRESPPAQIVLCAGLGVAVGFVTVLVHWAMLGAHRLTFHLGHQQHLSSAHDLSSMRVLLVPTLGGAFLGLVTLLIRLWRPREIVDPIEANAIYGGRMSLIDSTRLLFAALLSNAAGASMGMEAGFSQIGSGIMSWVGQRLQFRREDLRIFVAAGSAAAIAAAFNAPLAGAFYGFELVLSTYTVVALPQVAVAALASVLTMRTFTHGEMLFTLPLDFTSIPPWNYPFFVILGIGSAGIGIGTMKLVARCEQISQKLPLPEWLHPAVGGLILSLIAVMFPQVLGSGQGAIDDHLHNHWPLLMLVALMVAKIVASAVSVGAGFRGGLFSSSLLIGCLFGQIMGMVAGIVMPQTQQESFMLVGMGAVGASIIGAPVTMVLLILEMTGNFPATTAVLLGVLIASALTRYMFGYSFSTWRFHLRGLRISGAHDIGWIRDITVRKLMQEGGHLVEAATPLVELRLAVPADSTRRIFVIDEDQRYQGVIDVAQLHSADLDKDVGGMTALNLAKARDAYLLPVQNIQQALERFAAYEQEVLPVLASDVDTKVLGYVSEAYALRRYAHELESRNVALSNAGSPVSEG
ncbi:MAG: chloride channel protein [Alphaproteobacteria bacterium]